MKTPDNNPLGSFLKDRRAKLTPEGLELASQRRRTPGLRREEIAQRAHVSITWYTWLEQGRGGSPSADVLDRLARALSLEEAEREHLYLLAQGRPPEASLPKSILAISPSLQRLLDSMTTSPALVKDAAWNVVAWNAAAAAVLIDYATLPPKGRNVLHLVFCHPRIRESMPDWEQTARFTIATFRAETARTGMTKQAQALIEAMKHASPEFEKMWQERDVRRLGEGTKRIQPDTGDPITVEYSSFAVDGQPGLSMVVYMPATSSDARRIESLVARHNDAAFLPDSRKHQERP